MALHKQQVPLLHRPPSHPLIPHPDPSGFAQPHLSLLALPHGCTPTPSLPAVLQASKLSAGLMLQAGGEEEEGMKAMLGSSPQREADSSTGHQ